MPNRRRFTLYQYRYAELKHIQKVTLMLHGSSLLPSPPPKKKIFFPNWQIFFLQEIFPILRHCRRDYATVLVGTFDSNFFNTKNCANQTTEHMLEVALLKFKLKITIKYIDIWFVQIKLVQMHLFSLWSVVQCFISIYICGFWNYIFSRNSFLHVLNSMWIKFEGHTLS